MHNSKSLETSRKMFSKYIKNTESNNFTRGATPCPRGWGARPTPRRASLPSGPPVGPPVPIFCYMKSFVWRKIISKLSGRDSAATRRNLGGTNLGLRQSYSTGETSLREGEIEVVVITNDPLIVGGSIFINIFTSTISSQTLVHLLCSILLPEI